MDFAKALTFMWEDPRWKEKLAIGTVVMLISGALMPVLIGFIGILIVMGYGVRLLQNVRSGNQYPLPEWDQWGEDLTRGFKLFVVSLVWGLPFILLGMPAAIGGIMLAAGADNSADAMAALGGLTMGLGYCLIFIYSIFFYVMMPGFTLWFARNEQISEGLKFTEIWQWTMRNLGGVIMAVLAFVIASFAISIVASVVGTVLCIVGLIVTIPLGMLATYLYQYHLIGQLSYKDEYGKPYYTPAPPPPPAAPYAPVNPAPVDPAPVNPVPPAPAEPPAAGTDQPQV